MQRTTPNQAIRNAIEAEYAAARFYSLLAESTADRRSRAFLEDMAGYERLHARHIRELGAVLVDGPLAEHADSDIGLVETLADWRFVDDIGIPEALAVALAAEEQAALFYDALAEYFDEPVKTFFLDLAATEEAHAAALRERRRKLGLSTD